MGGCFLPSWVISYGVVQSIAPLLLRSKTRGAPTGTTAFGWAVALCLVTAVLALALSSHLSPTLVLLVGLILFGIVFAINSSLHSYLIVNYAKDDGVSLDVGFYYMANACGRLVGTLLSGYLYHLGGLSLCLWGSVVFLLLVVIISTGLPKTNTQQVEQ